MLKKKLEGSVDKEQSEREVVVKRTEVMSLKINSATCAINETEVEVLEESEREVVQVIARSWLKRDVQRGCG